MKNNEMKIQKLSALDSILEWEKTRQKKTDKLATDRHKMIAKLDRECGKISEKIDFSKRKFDSLSEQYLLAIQGLQTRTEEAVAENDVLTTDLTAAKIHASNFMAMRRDPHRIRGEERAKYETEIAEARESIREAHLEYINLRRQWFSKASEIQRLAARTFDDLYRLREKTLEELRGQVSSDFQYQALRRSFEQHSLDQPQSWTWQVESLDDLEAIAIRAEVKPEHLPQLFAYIDECRDNGGLSGKIDVQYCRISFGAETGFLFPVTVDLMGKTIVTTNQNVFADQTSFGKEKSHE